MQVYLVPVGAKRHHLYVEIDDDEETGTAATEPPRGWIGRQMSRFRAMLAEAEAERRRTERGETVKSSGLWKWILRKIAETIAEQRLLWHLRGETAVDLRYPPDLGADGALKEVREEFARDSAKHLRWLVIDGLLVAITGPLFFFVPGPNVISWYFTFRAVAHFLSWRGARKGRSVIDWRPEMCPPLADVRLAIQLPAADRRKRLEAISTALGLKHFTGFVERVSS
ncbi:MAG TPA: hypothetical protein VN700_12850 [Vicinamibacterales bacterium]|nr:hypothetical protein [Vicinamibacterales bacterium]